MLYRKNNLQWFWAEAVDTAMHVNNWVYLMPGTKTTLYEIWTGIKPIVRYFATFGSKCYILRDRENFEKFDSISDESIFLGYSLTSKAYRVYNLKSFIVLESINVVEDDGRTSNYSSDDGGGMMLEQVNDSNDNKRERPKEKESESKVHPKGQRSLASSDMNVASDNDHDQQKEPSSVHPRSQKGQVMKDNPLDKVIGDVEAPIKKRKHVRDEVSHLCYVSFIEPKIVNEALYDDSWINAMHEELEQFERNNVRELLPRPTHTNVISTKWIFKKKTNKLGQVIRSKTQLVEQECTQVELILMKPSPLLLVLNPSEFFCQLHVL